MERKYYLRGLGLGIIITAVIMGVALSGRRTMTDDEIIARARELGMVENTVLADTEDLAAESAGAEDEGGLPVKGTEAETDESGQEQTGKSESAGEREDMDVGAGENAEEEDGAAVSEDAGLKESVEVVPGDQYATPGPPQAEVPVVDADTSSGDLAEDAGAAQETSDAAAGEEMVITINSGDGSYTVAKKLAAAGVVTSAENFDTFLCENGYDKRLRTGEFSIPADAGDEQIARIVTGME